MLDYIIKFTTGGQVEINEEEYKAILNASDNASIWLKRLGIMVQKRMVQVFPKNIADQMKDRKKQQIGILHDGTKVRRHFGQWVVDGDDVPDDKGNYVPVKLDKNYYPEVARDCVFSIEEFEKIKHLSTQERLEKIGGSGEKIKGNGFKKIGGMLKKIKLSLF